MGTILFSTLLNLWLNSEDDTNTNTYDHQKSDDTKYAVDGKISHKTVKLVIFVPEKYASIVRDVLGRENAGAIGDYSYSFISTSVNTFYKKIKKGQKGLESPLQMDIEERIETVVRRELLSKVLAEVSRFCP